MKTFVPESNQAFQCIGSRCSDNCCIGWEIDIDPKTAAFYQQLPDPFGEKLRASIQWGEVPFFRLVEGERCPLLNGDNLCEIILQLGEGALCEICGRHPRFLNFLPGRLEIGLGLCCEEAARLLLTQKSRARLTDWHGTAGQWGEADDGDWEEGDNSFCDILLESRETAFSLIQNRALPVGERAALLLLFGEDMQEWLDSGEGGSPALCFYGRSAPADIQRSFPHTSVPSGEKSRLFQEIGAFYQKLERLDESWTAVLHKLGQELPEETEKAFWQQGGEALTTACEQLLWYYVYRYWMGAMDDGELKSRAVLAVCSFLVLARLGQVFFQERGSFSVENLTELARRYAKEVEYSPDNMEALADAAWEEECLAADRLYTLLGNI